VNHRYLDIGIRLPTALSSFETEAKKLIQGRLERGRINVLMTFEGELPGAGKLEFDHGLARQYIDTAREFAGEAELKDDIGATSALRIPQLWTLKTPRPEELTELWDLARAALDGAIDQLIEMRKTEGANLWKDLSERIEKMREVTAEIEVRVPTVIDEYRERLRERISSVLPAELEIDEQRLLTEMAMFADKADISEEISRLGSHVQQFETLADQESNVGRRLDFLIQEMFREITTIGSKARDATISHEVVEVKGLLEKMREQIQNVE
jgi:uncharacterized protein (TIGR00255 family)